MRKLGPALYNLAHEGALPERFNLIGVSRRDLGDEGFRDSLRESIERYSRRSPDARVLDALLARVRYVQSGFDDAAGYQRLGKALEAFDREAGLPVNRVFYLSTAPGFFPVIVDALGAAGLNRHPDAEVRVVIEKPFGSDLASARTLNGTVLEVFEERQVYRIDHYLGKETVQNLLAFRFANGMFEPIWNRNYIDSVQITAAEEIGIGSRAGYYDSSGALRDLVQNHMLQLLDAPVHGAAVRLLGGQAARREGEGGARDRVPTPDEVRAIAVRGQYGPGVSGGTRCPATSTRRACRTPR